MRIAVVGSGIGGMASAWLLSAENEVDVYEAEERLGGHARTVDVDTAAGTFPVDTGFMVFNRRTYPNLTRFFERLGMDAVDADMSFSVQVPDAAVEWGANGASGVFAQRRNLFRPRFLMMLADAVRLSRDADRLLEDTALERLTLGEMLSRERYSRSFCDWYLVPMGAAIWSTPPGQMLEYPAGTFLRFCDNHGLLRVTDDPKWLSLPGGARRYVEAASRSLSGEVHTGEPVERIERRGSCVRVTTPRRTVDYDAVVVATHPPQTRELLGDGMTAAEDEVLSAFRYRPNDIVLHRDESFLPLRRRAWASWNYFSIPGGEGPSTLVLTYRLNTLQSLPERAPSVLVTLNRDREVAPGTEFSRFVLDHPLYDAAAVAAQSRLATIQGADRVWYAGAWTRYGFHEDGMLSGVRVAEALGARVPWGDELDSTRTRVRPGAPVPVLGQTRPLGRSETPIVDADAEPYRSHGRSSAVS